MKTKSKLILALLFMGGTIINASAQTPPSGESRVSIGELAKISRKATDAEMRQAGSGTYFNSAKVCAVSVGKVAYSGAKTVAGGMATYGSVMTIPATGGMSSFAAAKSFVGAVSSAKKTGTYGAAAINNCTPFVNKTYTAFKSYFH